MNLTTNNEKRMADANISAVAPTTKRNRLLFIGPGTHLIGGASTSTKEFVTVVSEMPDYHVETIDSSPPPGYYRNRRTLVTMEKTQRAVYVLKEFIGKIRCVDAVVMFVNNQFTFVFGPIFWLIAKFYGKAIYLRPVGGDLDLDIINLNPLIRAFVMSALCGMDAIIAETQLLQQALIELGCERVYYIPNWRNQISVHESEMQHSDSGTLKLVYLSQIHEAKGVFVLLETLRQLEQDAQLAIDCDFYGPIYPDIQNEFLRQIEKSSIVQYKGAIPYEEVLDTLKRYDALALPTHYICEGHPGIIIEAVQLGLPVISTQHRAIPELVEDGITGLLVPKHDSVALATAVRMLAEDAQLRKSMAAVSRKKGREFNATEVIPQLLKIVFPESAPTVISIQQS